LIEAGASLDCALCVWKEETPLHLYLHCFSKNIFLHCDFASKVWYNVFSLSWFIFGDSPGFFSLFLNVWVRLQKKKNLRKGILV